MRSKIDLCNAFIEKYQRDKACRLCPRNCNVDRTLKIGACGEPINMRIASINLHHGEEPPISGVNGSGAVFFSGCNLHCVFCQNYPLSQQHLAHRDISPEKLAEEMLKLEKRGAHNINFVTPTHESLQIVKSLKIAFQNGLSLPIVWNTGGYEKTEIIRDLNGIVDIYLCDAKYGDDKLAKRLSGVSDYVLYNRKAIEEMFRQKGTDLILDKNGILREGLIIRHLVLPSQIKNSLNILKWLSNISVNIHLSLMSQYFPAYRVVNESGFSDLNRKINTEEYEKVLDEAESLGFHRGWWQKTDENI